MPEGIEFLAPQVTKIREFMNASGILLVKFLVMNYCGKHEVRWEEST